MTAAVNIHRAPGFLCQGEPSAALSQPHWCPEFISSLAEQSGASSLAGQPMVCLSLGIPCSPKKFKGSFPRLIGHCTAIQFPQRLFDVYGQEHLSSALHQECFCSLSSVTAAATSQCVVASCHVGMAGPLPRHLHPSTTALMEYPLLSRCISSFTRCSEMLDEKNKWEVSVAGSPQSSGFGGALAGL